MLPVTTLSHKGSHEAGGDSVASSWQLPAGNPHYQWLETGRLGLTSRAVSEDASYRHQVFTLYSEAWGLSFQSIYLNLLISSAKDISNTHSILSPSFDISSNIQASSVGGDMANRST